MKEEIITDIQRKKAILMGLFIARFSKKALESFGFTTYKEAYNVFGYSVNIPPSSIKLYQQEFDRFFPNGRAGWKRPVRDYCKAVMDECKDLKFDDFHKLVNSIVLDKYVDIKDIKSNYRHAPKSRQFLANRLITGKAAEEYFVMNYPSIAPFQNYLLTDTTNMGCGFDYKLSLEESNYYVEVKGINERQGSILMTEKEYTWPKTFWSVIASSSSATLRILLYISYSSIQSVAVICYSSGRSGTSDKYHSKQTSYKTMKYKFEVTQTIYKYIEVEAADESEAYGKVDKMLGEGEIRFDDEPFLKMECNYALLPSE